MAHRREFLKAGLRVIFDEQFSACRAFAAEATRAGAPIQAIRGDITNLWFDDLHRRWQDGPAAVAGLTGYGALFCLEQLAWDHASWKRRG